MEENTERKDLTEETLDSEGAVVRQKGVWKRFFHTCRVARLPYVLLAVYIALLIGEGWIMIRIPQINGNFFAGDVSVKSVLMFIGFELLNMVVSQGILYVNHVIRYEKIGRQQPFRQYPQHGHAGKNPAVFQGDLRLVDNDRKRPKRREPAQQRLVQRQLLRLSVKEKQFVHRHDLMLRFRHSRSSMTTRIVSPSHFPRAARMAFVTPMM